MINSDGVSSLKSTNSLGNWCLSSGVLMQNFAQINPWLCNTKKPFFTFKFSLWYVEAGTCYYYGISQTYLVKSLTTIFQILIVVSPLWTCPNRNYSRRALTPKYVPAFEICEDKLLTITITLTFKLNELHFNLAFGRIHYSLSIKLMTGSVEKSMFLLTGQVSLVPLPLRCNG